VGDGRYAYRALEEKPFPKSPLGRPRLRWENNIKMDFQEVVGGHGLDVCGSGYGQVVGTCEYRVNLRVPYNAGNVLSSLNRLASQDGLRSMELIKLYKASLSKLIRQ